MAFKGFGFGNGAFREDEWKVIQKTILEYHLLQVVEIGAGYSTLLLSELLASCTPSGRVVSFEENPKWAAEVVKKLPYGNADVVLYRYPAFSKQMERLLHSPDMVFVDGPAGGADGRVHAMGFARKLNPKCIFVHDAGRQKERDAIDHVHFMDWDEKKFGSGLSLFYPRF